MLVWSFLGARSAGRAVKPNKFHWDWRALLVAAVTVVVVLLLNPVRFDFIQILQRGPRLLPSLAPVAAVVFGLPAMFGYMLGVLITNLQDGFTALNLFTGLWSALGWVWIMWIPCKAMGRLNFSTPNAALGTLGRFYLWAVIVGPLLHLWMSPTQQVLMGGDPNAVWARMVPMIAINHDLPFLIVGPIALAILYPLAILSHLYWWDRQEAVAPS